MYIVTIYFYTPYNYLFIMDRYWLSEDNPKIRKKIIDNFPDSNFLDRKSFIYGKRDYLDFSTFDNERYRVTIRECDLEHYNDLKKQGKLSDMFWRYW